MIVLWIVLWGAVAYVAIGIVTALGHGIYYYRRPDLLEWADYMGAKAWAIAIMDGILWPDSLSRLAFAKRRRKRAELATKPWWKS